MRYIPTNKATGVKYPAITEQERAAMEKDPATKGKYVFAPVPEKEKKPEAIPPIEAKKAHESKEPWPIKAAPEAD